MTSSRNIPRNKLENTQNLMPVFFSLQGNAILNCLVYFWISGGLFMPIIGTGLILMLWNSRGTQQGSCSSLCDSRHAEKVT